MTSRKADLSWSPLCTAPGGQLPPLSCRPTACGTAPAPLRPRARPPARPPPTCASTCGSSPRPRPPGPPRPECSSRRSRRTGRAPPPREPPAAAPPAAAPPPREPWREPQLARLRRPHSACPCRACRSCRAPLRSAPTHRPRRGGLLLRRRRAAEPPRRTRRTRRQRRQSHAHAPARPAPPG